MSAITNIKCNTLDCEKPSTIKINDRYFFCTDCYIKRENINLYKKNYYRKNMKSIKEKAKLQNVKTREHLRSIRERYKYL